jgi:hypothetical protein
VTPTKKENEETDSRMLIRIHSWMVDKADPLIDKHEKVLFEGEGDEKPSLVVSVSNIDMKFDLMIAFFTFVGKFIIGALTLITLLIAINAVWGPVIRHFFGLPVSYSLPNSEPGVSSNPEKPHAADMKIPSNP